MHLTNTKENEMTFCCLNIETPLDIKNKGDDLFVSFTMVYDGDKKFTFNNLKTHEGEHHMMFYVSLKQVFRDLVEAKTILQTNVTSKEGIKEFEFAKSYLLECVDYLDKEIVRSKKHQEQLCTHQA